MTIVKPKSRRFNKINFLIILLGLSLGSSVLGGMLTYNELVNLRHDISKQDMALRKEEVSNAELKNQLYSIIDVKNLETLVGERSLVLEKNPDYFKTQGESLLKPASRNLVQGN